jgi:hypothetical protein
MQQIIRHLFKTDSLEEVPRERLEELVGEYPSFSVARYLLSSKLRSENADNFTEETQRTNLYFTNPFWLHWLLQEKADEKGWGPRSHAEEGTTAVAVAEETAVIAMGEAVGHDEAPPWEEAIVQPADEDQPRHEFGGEPVREHLNGTIAEPAHDEVNENEVVEEITVPPVAEVEETANEPVITAAEPQHAEASPEPQLVFQSYHTIDYFASQGIKFTAEENPSDRLGRQMKSFTEWLKVMKRIPQKEADVIPDAITEHKIQAIAAHSIEGREIVTETMAEVLAKQGMWEKAAEVYRKLSLLNPDKSSYFAGKIEEIEARSNN